MLGSNQLRTMPISLELVPSKSGWDAFLLPVSGFPLHIEEFAEIRQFFRQFSTVISETPNMSAEVFLQLNQLALSDGRTRLFNNGARWMPEMGLGFWPDRDPPTLWTMADFENMEDIEKGPRPLMHQALRISAKQPARDEARDLLLDLGTIIQMMTRGSSDILLERSLKLALSHITEPSLRCYPLYVPLIEKKNVESATSQQLDKWMGGASLYIRESIEDSGILILSQEPLQENLIRLGGKRDKSSSKWIFSPEN